MESKDGHISSEVLIEDLQRVGDLVRRPPKTKDITKYGKFAYSTYKDRFGGINEALDEAGYNASDRFSGGWVSKSELIDDINTVAESVVRLPRVTDVETHSKYRYFRYRSKFEHWYELLDEAGLERTFTTNKYGNLGDELLTNIQNVGAETGRIPTTSDLYELGEYNAPVYVRNYESVSIAAALAGFDIEPSIPTRQVSDGELLSSISDVADSIGHPPTTTEYNEHGNHAISTVSQRFGTWTGAVHTATGEVPSSNRRLTDQELISDLRRVSAQLIQSPQTQDIVEHTSHSYDTYIQHFGTWEDTLTAAEIPASDNPEDTDIGGIVWHVIWLLNYIGDIPHAEEIEEHHPVMYRQCCEQHGDWESAVKTAQRTVSNILG